MVLEHLQHRRRASGRKDDSIHFTSLAPWPGDYIGAEGRFMEGETERRAAIFIGPEFGTCPAPTWSPPPARRPRRASTC